MQIKIRAIGRQKLHVVNFIHEHNSHNGHEDYSVEKNVVENAEEMVKLFYFLIIKHF